MQFPQVDSLSPRRLAALAVVAAVIACRPAAATTADELCPPTPTACVIQADFLITDGSTLDFGTRPVTLKQGRKLDVVAGTMTILAGNLTLEPGSSLFARGATDRAGTTGGRISITTTGDIRIQASATGRARIDVSAELVAGSVSIRAGGNFELNGIIAAQGTTPSGGGGQIDVTTTGSVTLADKSEITSFGGTLSAGGDLTVFSGGSMVANGQIDCHGGDGGTIVFQSNDDITTSSGAILDVSSIEPFGDGGSVTLVTGGNVLLGGQIAGQGAGGSIDGGSAGGDVTLAASGSLTVAAQINLSGASPDGEGGNAELTANGDIVQTGMLLLRGRGGQGTGGSFSVAAGRNVTLGAVDVGGGLFGAGDVTGTAGDTFTVTDEVNADSDAGFGGSIIFAAETMQVAGNLHANGVAGGNGGSTDLQACTLNLQGSARLVARPAPGTNTLRASGQMTLANGSMLLATNANVLQYRVLVPIRNGTIDPAPQLIVNFNLPRCAGEPAPDCGNGVVDIGEDCDDHNTSSCDGCSARCHVEEGFVCGDGKVNFACGERCDDGNHVSCDGCRADCAQPDRVCGDGVQECGELCDDGNTTSCDGCSALCRPDKMCGDGVTECGEECDEGAGNGQAGSTCDAGCHIIALASCGDGHIDRPGEECDDQNRRDCDGCSATCHRELCGNNVIDCQGATRETCDDGNRDACDGCSPTCKLETCGNRVVDCGERCDDGNTTNGDGCDVNCIPSGCGNGIRTAGEQCDDGNLNPGDGCDPSCHIEVPCPGGVGFCTPCEVDTDCDPAGQCAGRKCVAGACASVPPPTCDDGRRDTRDTCVLDAAGAPACQHDCLAASACDDGNKCNGAEACTAGRCTKSPDLVCEDNNPCTIDECVAAVGCQPRQKTHFEAIDCRFEIFDHALANAPPGDLAAAVGRKIGKARTQAEGKIVGAKAAAAAGNTKREKKMLNAAKGRFGAIERLVGTAQVRNKISPALADELAATANGAKDTVIVILGELPPR